MNSDEYNSTDLTVYGNDVGGGGSYQNVNINSKGFDLSIEHFLSEACKYDAQITMHVSFGRIGLLVRLQSFVYFILKQARPTKRNASDTNLFNSYVLLF